ncbi:MAG TPA: hypothetical protein VHE12_01250 [bacterium]|nr:hypothetical protein [bacterium]
MRNPFLRSFLVLFLPFALLFSLRTLAQVRSQSLTNDEPSDVANGYYYWTRGDVVNNPNHPPLGTALQALPLLGMGLKSGTDASDFIDRGHRFFFEWNPDRLGPLTLWPRLVSVILGVIAGLFLWGVTWRRPVACFGALLFWALDPVFSAMSALAKNEIAPALFFFLALMLFQAAQRRPTLGRMCLAGFVTALAVNAKLYCLVLFPIYAVLEALFLREKENLLRWAEVRRVVRPRWIILAGSILAVTFLVFLPATLAEPAHHQPFYYLFLKIKETFLYGKRSLPVFLFGKASFEDHWYYLPVAFLLKEPIPFLLFLGAGTFFGLRGRISLPAWTWVPVLFFNAMLIPSPNLGVRYLLPIFPLLFLIAGEGVAWAWADRFGRLSLHFSKALVAVLGFWLVVSVLGFPGTSLGYFNEMVPVEKRIHYLADSNLDWGQDLKRLGHFAERKGWGKVRLAYLGGVDPKVYGLDWVPWDSDDLKGPQPGRVYLVNASFLQLGPLSYPSVKPIAEGWLADRKPDGRIGDAWYYFEVPGQEKADPKAKFWVSAPFLEYRGYTPFYSIPR